MAKIRRIVRKVPHTSGDYFDEKIWPVYIALVILGAFLMGVSAAYLKFSGVTWYANAVTSLIGIPLVVVGFMVAFRFVDNRLIRRSMQLAVVISAILHLAMVVQMIETRMLAGLQDEVVAEREVIEPRRQRLMPEYQSVQMLPEEQRPKQDFEKPLEVKTPEPQPEPENFVRQETRPETSQAPEQPVPAPEPVATTEPNVVKRNQPNEVAPRAAEQMSKLSRQSKPSDLKISQLVQSLPIEQPRPAGMEAKPAAARVERQSTEPMATPLAAAEAPVSPTASATPQLSRKSDAPSPEVNAAPTPTLKRQVAQPTRTPTSPIASADLPPQPKSTSPDALAPASTFTQKQATASPQVTRTDAPLPEIASTADAPLQRRQSPAETAPQVAQSPSPTPNRQPKATARPDVAATAAVALPSTANPSATTASELTPQNSRIERARAAVTSSQPAPTPSTEPTTAQASIAAARPTRMEGRETPAPISSTSATPTLTRKSSTPSIASATEVQPAPTGTVTSAAATELAASSMATRRQATNTPQASPNAGEPTATQLAAIARTAASGTAQPRRASGTPSDIPTLGPTGPTTPSPTRSTTAAVANVVTRAADVPTNAGPQLADSALPGPSTTAIARQSGGAAASAANPSPAPSPDAPGSVAMAAGALTRAQIADVPTMRPQVLAGNSPARAATNAPTASSPTAVESPASTVATTSGQLAPQAARLALSRSQGGTAGVGQSPNLERATPGSESPALVASGAARRAEATSQTPGDAFTPSSPAQIARSAAGELKPTATARAEAANVGNTPGATQIADLAANSSATLTRADAQAPPSQVTGAKGTADIDVGPTQLVAERGGTRAAGGGQSEPHMELSAAQVARSEAGGGKPQMSLAGAQVAETVAAPMGETGGASSLEAQVAGVAKSSSTATAAATGAAATAGGTLSESTAAQLLARSEMSRAQASQGAAGGGAAGPADLEDEEEKARRLARAAQGGAPQVAVAGPMVANVVASPKGEGGDAGAAPLPEASAVATTASRMTALGGAPAGGAAAPLGEAGTSRDAGGAAAVASVAIARAEAADGTPGTPLIGGGSESPAKASSAPTFAANTTADTIQLAGAPQSSGDPGGVALAASGTQTQRMAGGASGPVTNDPQGAAAGDEAILATSGVAPARGKRQIVGGTTGGPQVADAATAAPLAKAGAAAGPSSSAVVTDIPEVGAGSAVAQAELDHGMGGTAKMPMTRQSGEALAVHVEAAEGPGGLGTEYSPEVGINSRKAREESLHVQTAAARFVRTAVGGLPAISTTVIVSRESFAKRSSRLMGDQPGSGRGVNSPETEAAIERGLEFLARHQHSDGHWSLQGFDDVTSAVSEDERRFMLVSDTGATALALLAFQGGGYTHRAHKYKDSLLRGINHLLAYQKANGDLFVPLDDRSNQSVWLYSHALATLALCEAYGMTQDPALKEPAQRAIDFIVASQNKDLGGWRYSPGISTDTSVTGWMIAALYSGRLAGLEVPSESFARIDKWMNSAQGSAGDAHLYRYNPFAPETSAQRHGRLPSKTMTAVGLLSRVFLGWKQDHPGFEQGAMFLGENLPAIGTEREPLRDTYYWYYATLTLVYLKERDDRYLPVWQQWEKALFPLLRDTQESRGPWAGSWNPRGPVPDRWALHAGRLYVTTMNLLSLEANYRFLPTHAAVQGSK